MWTQIRLLLYEQSDLGPHCLPVCKNRFEKFARIFSRRHKQTTFSDAGFLGALRVNGLVANSLDPDWMLHSLGLYCLLSPVCPTLRVIMVGNMKRTYIFVCLQFVLLTGI